MAPLKIPSILECFNWVHGNTCEERVIEQNARAAFAELALHDQETFDNYVQRIKMVCGDEYELTLVNQDYHDYRLMVRDNTLLTNLPELNWT